MLGLGLSDNELARLNDIEESPPFNSADFGFDGDGLTIGLGVDGLLRDFELLGEYFDSHDETSATAEGYFTWGASKLISPMMMHMGAKAYYDNDLPVSVQMFDAWAAYSVEYLGYAEGRKYIEEELGCSLESASEGDKLRVFAKTY